MTLDDKKESPGLHMFAIPRTEVPFEFIRVLLDAADDVIAMYASWGQTELSERVWEATTAVRPFLNEYENTREESS